MEFYYRHKYTLKRGCRLFKRDSYYPGFWTVSYGQTLIKERIIHELRQVRGKEKEGENSRNRSGFPE
jgi:hypothetical protein